MTSILSWLGGSYQLVNQDHTLSRDTTTACGNASAGGSGRKPPKL